MKKYYKINLGLFSIASLLLSLIILGDLYAKPMFAPTKEEAFKSEWIVIAQYIGYKTCPQGEINYFQGPIAEYKILRIIKGTNLPDVLKVRYDFHDGSACLPLKGWKFTEDKMPRVKSEWLLFLDEKIENEIFSTYRGDYGRWEAIEKNIKEIEESLKNKNKPL